MNKWGFRLKLHPLFHLVIFFAIITGSFIELITLFAIVFVHELGHIYAAKSLGWKVIEIQLLPFGGVAVIEQQGMVPAWEEIVIALAGPLQNAALAGIAWVMMKAGWIQPTWCLYFIQVNVMIGLFNLIPTFPLDGGRIMQGVVSYWLGYYKTLTLCIWISMAVSCMMLLYAGYLMITLGIPLHLITISLFLVYSNWVHLRNIPYLFLRFLLRRQQALVIWRRNGKAMTPLLADRSERVANIVKRLKHDHPHFIYMKDKDDRIHLIASEQRLLHNYLYYSLGKSTLGELFMLK